MFFYKLSGDVKLISNMCAQHVDGVSAAKWKWSDSLAWADGDVGHTEAAAPGTLY